VSQPHLSLRKLVGWLQGRFSLTHREVGTCLWDSYVPEQMRTDRELLRRSRLQIRFGRIGSLLGWSYTVFYMAIQHWWGAGIIALCSLVFSFVPGLLKRTANLHLTGHIYGLILLCCFSGLAAVEGGLSGHALGWLAAVPMSLLLLLELRDALLWAALGMMVTITFGTLEMAGHVFPKTYPLKWEAVVGFAGFGGLLPIILLLGVVFERNRARAVNELQEALDELSATNQQLRKVNEDKNEFLKIAAHDLKNPLAAINGCAELLMDGQTPTANELQEAPTTILRQSNRMLEIISNVLDVQRIEEGSMQMDLVEYPVERLLEKMVRSYARRAAQKGIQLYLQRENDVPRVRADESAVEHILDNLLSNAVKYSPYDAIVDCVIVTDADFVHIEVRDHGPGLSEEDQQNLFKKFTRLTPQPTGGESSNGLGLWIVRRMALAMGGNVSCRSALGAGSTFDVSLPRWVERDVPKFEQAQAKG
jgi:signal transduction histidine kinase